MFPSPAPSPSPSPGPAYLYLNSHHNNSGAVGAGGSAASGGSNNANGFGPPPPPPNGSGAFGLPRFPQQQQPGAPAGLGGWGPRSHHQHQQNPSLSSLPGSLAHSSAASSLSAPNGGPSSPGAFAALHHPSQHHHPHHHPHASHTPSNLSHMPSPGPLSNSSSAPHFSSSGSNSNAMGGGSGGGNGGGGGSSSFSPHWQQQLIKAEVSTYAQQDRVPRRPRSLTLTSTPGPQISRQSTSAHHHARAAALAARSATSAAIAIQDPNKGTMHIPQTAANGLTLSSKKEAQSDDGPDGVDANGSKAASTAAGSADDNEQSWTTIDMGGLSLRNLAPELYRYDFLTSLFINHNNLTTLSPDIAHLKKLTILDASGNNLVSLPSEMGMLTGLKELYLFDNQLTMLPPELGMLFNLDMLGIEGNPMADNIRSLAQREGTQAVIAFLRDSCPVPLPPPEREWISIEPDLPQSRDDDAAPTETFNALSYNVLGEHYATQSMYGYTPSWALSWEYRKEFILQEVMSYGADICCLQEVVAEQYEEYFLHHLSQQDYEGVFWPKSRSKTMRDEERRRVDGCATFFKANKFALIEKQLIEFNQIALQRPDFKKTEDMFNRVMTKDNIAVVTLLENKDSGSRLIVVNVHIHWDPVFRDVKLVQVAMLMDELDKIAERFAKFPPKLNVAPGFPAAPKYTSGSQIPTMICGDFNSEPSSGVYDYMSTGSLSGDHEDFMNHTYGRYTAEGMTHRFALKSAYANIGELPFTNYTPNFEGIIDYVWYNQNALAVTGLLGEVEKGYLEKVVGFPNAHFPSDHICILSEFRVKHPRADGQSAGPTPRRVDFGSSFRDGGAR